MVSRTIVDSVATVEGPPSNLVELERTLAGLRARFPGVCFDRYLGAVPVLGERVHVAPGAAIVGAVHVADDVSIWYGCVNRGYVNRIENRPRSKIQDGTLIHHRDRDPTGVVEDVVVGHRVFLHGCHVEAATLIGIQATLLDGVRIGHGSIIGACALVTAGTTIPPHSLVLGVPAKVVKTLSPDDDATHRALAAKYTRLAHNYRRG